MASLRSAIPGARLGAVFAAATMVGFLAFKAPVSASVDETSADPEPIELAPTPKHARVSRKITQFIERYHYRRADVDNSLSSAILDRYLDTLDSNRLYFLAGDIASFGRYRYAVDDFVREGDVEAVFEIFRVYRERARERMGYAIALLEVEPDFTLEEAFVFDRSELPWPSSAKDMDEVWRQRVKNDGLSLVLTGKTWAETTEVLAKRYERVQRRIELFNSDDVFETFMSAYARTLDPHSSYLSPRNSEEYRIQMSLSYEGIGASLQLTEDYVTVLNIIPGGPAAIDGKLQPNDRITAVGQGDDGEMVDVIGWRLDDVVQLIRGPGGTVVQLQILPADAAPGSMENLLALTRDKVKLEEQAAKSKVITVPREGGELRVGVITVPSFYQDYAARARGDADYTSTTRDVENLINELQSQNIDGLVMDLRNNGGGHLTEATSLSGLFINKGPVVQLRNTLGKIEVLDDPVPEVAYSGPLAVLVNRFSASASEIFAGAIQDYGRGVVIGQQTFGKGSVQNLFSLDRYMPGKEFGQLTLTIGKYYRVTGESTQHRGVTPDISLPSAVDNDRVGESTRETALPWDRIHATAFSADRSLSTSISTLAQSHEQRAQRDPDFNFLLEDIAAFSDLRGRDSVSLNLAVREAERETSRVSRLERENTRRASLGLDPLVSLDDLDDQDRPDVLLDQTAGIVADMAALDAPIASPSATATTSKAAPGDST